MDREWHSPKEIPDEGKNLILIVDYLIQLGKYVGGKFVYILGWEVKEDIQGWRYDE